MGGPSLRREDSRCVGGTRRWEVALYELIALASESLCEATRDLGLIAVEQLESAKESRGFHRSEASRGSSIAYDQATIEEPQQHPIASGPMKSRDLCAFTRAEWPPEEGEVHPCFAGRHSKESESLDHRIGRPPGLRRRGRGRPEAWKRRAQLVVRVEKRSARHPRGLLADTAVPCVL